MITPQLFLNILFAFRRTITKNSAFLFIKNYCDSISLEFDKKDWHGDWRANDENTLNNFLELEWEEIIDGHYSNNSGLINPYSKNTSILDYDQTLSSGEGYRPAVFMTDNVEFSYEGNGNTDNIVGTIVMYFDKENGMTDYIEFYYVKKDGSKSELLGTIK